MWSRKISEADLERIRREAAADATLATQLTTVSNNLAAHLAECSRRYIEQERLQAAMHKQNTEKFDKINRIVWIATGGWGAVTFLSTVGIVAYEFFGRGH